MERPLRCALGWLSLMSDPPEPLVQNESWPGNNTSYAFPPSFEGDVSFERCEAFTPAPDNAEAQRKYEQSYRWDNPITAWMASNYKSRQWEQTWLRDYCARTEEACDRFRMKSAQPVHSTNGHLEARRNVGWSNEKALNAERPKPGGASWALWEYERSPGDKPAALARE